MDYSSDSLAGKRLFPTFALVKQLKPVMIMKTNGIWKPVTISGVTGILMGAGTVYGVQAFAHTNDETAVPSVDEKLKVTNADDGVSFKDAFDTARAELGPGGVFTWRGNIYNTYTADEWKSMTDEERELFANRVKPEISSADVDTSNVTEDATLTETTNETDDVTIAEATNDVEETTAATANATSWDELVNDDNDVRIIGYKDVEISNGQTVTVQGLEVNGQRVAVIDVDKDGEADYAMSDLNHNFQMDEGEVIDLHTGESVSFTNDDYAANTNDIDIIDGGAI